MARAYKYVTKYTSPNQNARNRKVAGITIHWWGTPSGQSASGIVSWLCDRRAGTSAHYVVSEDTVWCIVDPDRRAWHAGNSRANHDQIGIELDPNMSRRAATERTAAALIADLRAEYGDLPLSPHKRWTSTACPGNWDLGRLDRLARGGSVGVPTVPAGGASKPVVKPSKPATGKAPAFPLPSGYYYGPKSGPRASVSGHQRNTGTSDVVLYKGKYHAKGLRVWQKRMLARGWAGIGEADGLYGPKTARVTRQFQKSKGLVVDGKIGPKTWAAAWNEPVV